MLHMPYVFHNLQSKNSGATQSLTRIHSEFAKIPVTRHYHPFGCLTIMQPFFLNPVFYGRFMENLEQCERLVWNKPISYWRGGRLANC